MRKRLELQDKVRFVGEPQPNPILNVGDIGHVWGTGVGKSWVWIQFDHLSRPVALRTNEVEII